MSSTSMVFDYDTEFSDSILLDSLRNGDEEAFNLLFHRYHNAVYRVLLRLLRRSDEAEDVLQDTFVRLYRQPPRNGTSHSLGAWLYRVALNLGHNALRGELRRSARQERSALWTGQGGLDPDPAGAAVRNEERVLVRKVLGELRGDYQVSLVLRDEGLTYAEIAAVLGTTATNVGSILSRAEKQFKAYYLREVEGGGQQ